MICTNARIENSSTSGFNVFGNRTTVRVEQAGAGGGMARAMLMGGWIYLYGHNPLISIGNTGAVIGADGSTLIVQEIYDDKTGGSIIRGYLRSGPTSSAQFINAAGTPSNSFAQGKFVDMNLNAAGNFVSFTSPADFSEATPPSGSENLMSEIDAERTPRGIP